MPKNEAQTSDQPELMDYEDSRPTPEGLKPLVEAPDFVQEAIAARKAQSKA